MEVERPGVERQPLGFGADQAFVAPLVVHRAPEGVAAAPGDGVDAGADEVALAHVVRRDVDLHLLDRLERDRRDARAVAGRAAEPEGVVEVRPVDRDVVQPVVLTPPNDGPRGLRRQAREVARAGCRYRRQGRQRLRAIAVAAPVRAELNTGSDSATTVTVSDTATVRSVSVKSAATPRLTNTSLVTDGWKPSSDAVTVYGPPTRMPGIENRPSSRVTAS